MSRLFLVFLLVASLALTCARAAGPLDVQAPSSYPYYLQSPYINESEYLGQLQDARVAQRSIQKPPGATIAYDPRKPETLLAVAQSEAPVAVQLAPAANEPVAAQLKANSMSDKCLYDKRYFERFDECLSRKPYPTIGLPAFKNEDLLVKRGLLSERHGCAFILNSGLFKNYQIARFTVDSGDANKCLDTSSKVGLSLSFTNVTLTYLWTLRCLNRADQLLEDATLGGLSASDTSEGGQASRSICVGSSQNFGFASLQLSAVEAQVELATDIYKNWRVTNVTVAMVAPTPLSSAARGASLEASQQQAPAHSNSEAADVGLGVGLENPLPGTSIKDFTFESLDGDELNWRYLHLFQNWSRNKLHSNFLDQFRRFLWISLQRCLSESSERLPVKLVDVFTNQRF